MQFSHALRALPVVCSLAPALVTRDAHPAASPDTTGQAAARYRVATDGEWFYQEVTGKRLARLARGAVVAGGGPPGGRGGGARGGGGLRPPGGGGARAGGGAGPA